MGWRYWQKLCERDGVLFCAAYRAGNNCPPGQRIRIILDMLDQVRRDYRIDPEQTYVSGFSGGGRIACTLGFAMPEFFGGVIAIAGTNPLNNLDYLRHRVQDRLSVAFVTGERDFNRAENEKFMFPFFQELGIRSRLWVVPGLGHAVPGEPVLAEVKQWLDDDLARRRADVRARPTLACPDGENLLRNKLASRLLEAAEAELKDERRVWRGVTLLQGVVARYEGTPAGMKARKRLDEIKDNDRLLKLAGEQGGQEERTYLQAQAQALDRFGQTGKALQAWKVLSEQHPFSPEGRKAMEEVRRLSAALERQPYLGIGFRGRSLVVERVVAGGPADRAGVKPGDRLRSLDDATLGNYEDLQKALGRFKPGDRVRLTLDRAGRAETVTVVVGASTR
jgi:hypothetical protein